MKMIQTANKTVNIKESTKALLIAYKNHQRETFDDIIVRLINKDRKSVV